MEKGEGVETKERGSSGLKKANTKLVGSLQMEKGGTKFFDP